MWQRRWAIFCRIIVHLDYLNTMHFPMHFLLLLNLCLTFSSEPPSPPEDLEVTELHRDSVLITWKHSRNDGGSPITNYIIEKRETWKTSWAHVDRVRGAVTSAEIMYLQEGTSYNIRVMAENVAGLSEPTELDEAVVPKSPYSEWMDGFISSVSVFRTLHCLLEESKQSHHRAVWSFP